MTLLNRSFSLDVVRSHKVCRASVIRGIHRRFIPIADAYLFIALDVTVRAPDFEDGNNGLWKCLSHPSAKRHTEHMKIKLAFTSQDLSEQEKVAELATFAKGGRDILQRIERILRSPIPAFYTACSRGAYCSSLQTIWVADNVLGLLVPYIAQLAPNLKNVTLSTEGGFDCEDTHNSPLFRAEGSTALKRQPVLPLRNLTVVGCDRTWLFELLGEWNVQPETFTMYTTLEGWSHDDHFISLSKVGEWSGFRELELYQKEGGVTPITRKDVRTMMGLLSRSLDLAADLAKNGLAEISKFGYMSAATTGRRF